MSEIVTKIQALDMVDANEFIQRLIHIVDNTEQIRYLYQLCGIALSESDQHLDKERIHRNVDIIPDQETISNIILNFHARFPEKVCEVICAMFIVRAPPHTRGVVEYGYGVTDNTIHDIHKKVKKDLLMIQQQQKSFKRSPPVDNNTSLPVEKKKRTHQESIGLCSKCNQTPITADSFAQLCRECNRQTFTVTFQGKLYSGATFCNVKKRIAIPHLPLTLLDHYTYITCNCICHQNMLLVKTKGVSVSFP